jgi:WD40 repeat protein/serine/threonine protein kinase
MPIAIACNHCGSKLRAPENLAGRKVKCPRCGQAVAITAAPPPDPAAQSFEEQPGDRTLGTAHPPPASEAPTIPPDGVAPAGPAAAKAQDRELYDFLAPPQGEGEVGRLGSYRVLKVLGAGGMGVVFQAEDYQLQRLVALKVMKPTLAASDSARQRFLREARTTAAIEHDHIITIYQVGEYRGVPFLAMPFLKGETLDDRIRREGKLPLAEVLRIGREIADGLAAAHNKSLIHRDIKPANVWLESRPGERAVSRPGERGVSTPWCRVKILDFGLARAVGDETHLTQQGAIVGTPQYMAPEQSSGEFVDGRCDLFSLGCVLYRLCTGELPFKGKDMISMLAAVALQQPQPPLELNPEVPSKLSALVMQLLAKDPAQRPQSAGAVAVALQAIEDEQSTVPTSLTRPRATAQRADRPSSAVRDVEPTGLVRSRKKTREGRPRRPRWLPMAVVAAALLIALAAGAVVYLIAHRKNVDPLARPGQEPPPPPPGRPLSPLALVSQPASLPGVHGWTIETRGHRGAVKVTAYSADSRRLASGGEDGTVRIWEPISGRLLRVLVGHARGLSSVAWSPDAKLLASGGEDNTVRLWEADSGRLLRTLEGHTGAVRQLSWSPDGKTLASGSEDTTVRLWEAESGKPLRTFDKHPEPITGLTWRPDGKTLVSASLTKKQERRFWLWEAATAEGVRNHLAGNPATWSWDRMQLVYKSGIKTVRFWEMDSGKARTITLAEHSGPIYVLTLSPDGKTLATGGEKTVQFWEAGSGKLLRTCEGYDRTVHGLAWSPDGKLLASTGLHSPLLKLWKVDAAQPVRTLRGFGNLRYLQWSPDSKIISADPHFTREYWDASWGRPLYSLPMHFAGTYDVAWSPDGTILATTNPLDGRVQLWEADSGKFLRTIGPRLLGQHWLRPSWSPDGKVLAFQEGYTVRLWDVANDRALASLDGHTNVVAAMIWSPDGKHIATAGAYGGDVRFWDAATAQCLQILPLHLDADRALSWSREGNVFFVGDNRAIQRWVVATGKPLEPLAGHGGRVTAFAWSPDRRTLASGGADGTVLLWDATGRPLVPVKELQGTQGPVTALTWLADSQTVAALGANGVVCFWDSRSGKLGHTSPALTASARFSPNGRMLASHGEPSAVRLWEAETGRARGALVMLRPGQPGIYLAITPDGHYRGSHAIDLDLVCIVQTESGQETLLLDEFSQKYGWKSDPERVHLIGP